MFFGEEGIWQMPVKFAPLESSNAKGLNFESGCVMKADILPKLKPGEKIHCLLEKVRTALKKQGIREMKIELPMVQRGPC